MYFRVALISVLVAWVSIAHAASKADWSRCSDSDPKTAVPGCTRVLADRTLSKQDRATALRYRGWSHLDSNNLDEASKDAVQAIDLDPDVADAHFLSGRIHAERRDWETAVVDYTEGLRHDPGHDALREARGNAYAQRSDFKPAIADFEQLVSKNPKQANYLTLLGTALFATGDGERALELFSRAISLGSTNPKNYWYRASLHRERSNFAAAIADFDRYIAQNQEASAFSLRGHVKMLNGDKAGSVDDCRKARAAAIKQASAHTWCGRALALNKEFDAAIADFNAALKIDPRSVGAMEARAWAHLERGDFAAARTDFDSALGLEPTHTSALLGRGITRIKLGDLEGGMRDTEQTLRLSLPAHTSNLTAAHYWRAYVSEQRGLFAEARVGYKTAAEFVVGLRNPSAQELQVLARQALVRLDMAERSRTSQALAASPSKPLHRMALVIGNSDYKHTRPLDNPRHDTRAVAAALTDLGFQVTLRQDLDSVQLRSAFRDFEGQLRKASPDWAVVYFSGHGTETAEGAFMLPTDILLPKEGEPISDVTIVEDSVAVQNILKRLQPARQLRLVIFDACRDNPVLSAFNRMLAQSRQATPGGHRSTGLGFDGNIAIFAASAGTFALDGEAGQLSPFAKSFVSALRIEGLSLKDLYTRLRDEVSEATAKSRVVPQVPQAIGVGLDGNYVFNPGSVALVGAKREN